MLNVVDLQKTVEQAKQRFMRMVAFIRSNEFTRQPVKERLTSIFEMDQYNRFFQVLIKSHAFSNFLPQEIETFKNFTTDQWGSLRSCPLIYETIQALNEQYAEILFTAVEKELILRVLQATAKLDLVAKIKLLNVTGGGCLFSNFLPDEISVLKSIPEDKWCSLELCMLLYRQIQSLNEKYAQTYFVPSEITSISTLLENQGQSALAAKIVWPYLNRLTKELGTEIQKETFTGLRAYLSDYWQHRKNGYFCYTAIAKSHMTRLHIDLADLLFKAASADPTLYDITESSLESLSLMTFLMPGVCTETIMNDYADLAPKNAENMSEILMTHVISENGHYLIPVKVIQSLLTYQKEAEDSEESKPKRALLLPPTDPSIPVEELDIRHFRDVPNPYYEFSLGVEGNSPYLTPTETERLRNFSKQSIELFIMHEQYIELISRTSHLLGQCRILADRLLQNGKNGSGSIDEAGAGAEAAIHAFLDFYEKLVVNPSALPPLLIKEISFLRQCVRRCHPDEPVINYAATCTDAAYQRMYVAITGHEATLASIGLDAASEDYRKMVGDTKIRLVDHIRRFTPQTPESRYGALPVRTVDLLYVARVLGGLLSTPAQASPGATQEGLKKLLIPVSNLVQLIKSLLQFSAKELHQFSESPTISQILADLMGETIQTADEWLQFLTFISPEKITILHSPTVVTNILANIRTTPHIKVHDIVLNMLKCLVSLKRTVFLAAIRPVLITLPAVILDDDPTQSTFSQCEVETLNKLLTLLKAPVSPEYQLLRAKIKTFCDIADNARRPRFTSAETALLRAVFNQYTPAGLLQALKSYFTSIDALTLAGFCRILIYLDRAETVRSIFQQDILKIVLSNDPSSHPARIHRNFIKFLREFKILSEDIVVEKFVGVLQDTSTTWAKYMVTTQVARWITEIFPKQSQIFSEIVKGESDAWASRNSAQIKSLLQEFSDIDRESFFDRHRETIVKNIKVVPDFINIYICVKKDPLRRHLLFSACTDKFCELTVTYRHVRMMGENLHSDHFKEYLAILAPSFIEKITGTGQQEKPFFKNIALVLQWLNSEPIKQRLLIEFLNEKQDIRAHLKTNKRETEATAKDIKKVLAEEVKPLFEAFIASLRTAIATPFSFFGPGAAASAGEGGASALSGMHCPT